jgi:hypothetical protein
MQALAEDLATMRATGLIRQELMKMLKDVGIKPPPTPPSPSVPPNQLKLIKGGRE